MDGCQAVFGHADLSLQSLFQGLSGAPESAMLELLARALPGPYRGVPITPHRADGSQDLSVSVTAIRSADGQALRRITMTPYSAPDFTLPATGGQDFSLAAQRGKWVVLYFYPKDNTPGCTTEGSDFRDRHAQFAAKGAVIAGLSRDSLKSHENFKAKMSFPFELVSDPEEIACERYGVMKLKNMYGKQVRGIERSTFLIDPAGQVVREWRGLKVPGHAEEVLTTLNTLAG